MKILVLDAEILTPDCDAGSHRMLGILILLRALGHEVVFSAHKSERPPAYVRTIESAGVRVAPMALPDEKFDLFILSRPVIAGYYLDAVRAKWPAARVIFDTVDLHYVREFRGAKLLGSAAMLERAITFKRLELDLCRRVDQVWVVTDVEKKAIEQESPRSRVNVVSSPHEISVAGPPFSRRRGALFVGGFLHQPNVDAVQYYVTDILPRLRPRWSGAVTRVAGGRVPGSIQALAASDVDIMGWVPDVGELYDQVRVAIAPLRFGAGVKGKVLEAMSRGVPVVATSMALEGIPAEAGRNALVADDPLAFSDAVAQVHEDEALWTRLAEQGRKLVAEHFSMEAVRRQLAHALADAT